VRLESDELNEATTILATGLDCERDFTKPPGPLLDVTCEGDPRAEIGDKVPVIVSVESSGPDSAAKPLFTQSPIA
jgi:hypothetical protein